jgi:hypothetical protein
VSAGPLVADEPLRITTFTLSRADALAYERRIAAPLAQHDAVALVGWFSLWGAVPFMLPEDWTGPHLGWIFGLLVAICVALGGLLVLLAIAIRQLRAAHRRLPRAIEVTLTMWPDRLSMITSGVPRELPHADIRRLVPTRTHLFAVHDDDILMLPRSAFTDEGALEALAVACATSPMPAEIAVAVDPAVPSA